MSAPAARRFRPQAPDRSVLGLLPGWRERWSERIFTGKHPKRGWYLATTRHAPRGDDRLLRAALVLPARLPRARAARADRPRRRDELRRHRARAGLPGRLDQEPRQRRPYGAAERDHARDHRRRRAALGLAL